MYLEGGILRGRRTDKVEALCNAEWEGTMHRKKYSVQNSSDLIGVAGLLLR